MKTRRHEGELSPPLEVPRRRSVVTSPPSIAIAPGQVETMLGTEEAISIDDPPMPAPEAAPGAAPQGKNTAAKKQKIDYTGRSVYIKHVDVSPTDETDSVNVVWTGVLYRKGIDKHLYQVDWHKDSEEKAFKTGVCIDPRDIGKTILLGPPPVVQEA